MGPIGYPETSAMNCHLTLLHIPVESRSQRSVIPAVKVIYFLTFYICLFVFNPCVTKPSLFFRVQNGTDCRLSVVCSFFILTSEVQYDTFSRETIAEVRQWHSLFNVPQELTEAVGERNVGTRKDQ